jgi:hypothetical protein
MALSNFTRPQLPYDANSLANNDRFQVLTRALNAPPTDIMLDSELNALTDYANILDLKIEGLIAGTLPGVDDPNNTNFLVSTDGTNQIWTLLTDQNVQLGSVNGNKLIDSSVTAQQLQNGTVTSGKIAANTILSTNLADLSVTTPKIALQAVSSAQILNNTITLAQIAPNTITTNQIDLAAGIRGTQLAAGANIVGTQLSAGANILGTQLSAAAGIVGTQLSAGANILGTQLSAAAGIVGTQLAANTITRTQMAASVSATKAEQITATSTVAYTNPAVQQNHPSAAKFRCTFPGVFSGTIPPTEGYNVTSVTFNSAGNYTITFTVPFTTTTYTTIPSNSLNAGSVSSSCVRSQTMTNVTIASFGIGGGASNPDFIYVVGYGTQ